MLFVFVFGFAAPCKMSFDLFQHLPLQITEVLGINAKRLLLPRFFLHQHFTHFIFVEFSQLQPAGHALGIRAYEFAFVDQRHGGEQSERSYQFRGGGEYFEDECADRFLEGGDFEIFDLDGTIDGFPEVAGFLDRDADVFVEKD